MLSDSGAADEHRPRPPRRCRGARRHEKGDLVDLVNWLLHREARWGELSDCLTTERQSAIDAFRKISSMVEHDSKIGQIADAECASLARYALGIRL